MPFSYYKDIPDSIDYTSNIVVVAIHKSFYDCLTTTLPQAIVMHRLIPDAQIKLKYLDDITKDKEHVNFVFKILNFYNINFEVIEELPKNFVPGDNADINGSGAQIFVASVREALGLDSKLNNKKIYISRGNVKKSYPGTGVKDIRIDDETILEEYLYQHGWSILSPETLSLEDQIRYVNGAHMVMSLSGSGNLLGYFIGDGGTMIELVSPQIVIKPDNEGLPYVSKELHYHHVESAYSLNHNYFMVPHNKTAMGIINKIKDILWIQS